MKKINVFLVSLLVVSVLLAGCAADKKTVKIVNKNGTLVGKAFWMDEGMYRAEWEPVIPPVEEIKPVEKCLKDYEITAGMVQGYTDRGIIKINGEEFKLNLKDKKATSYGIVILNTVLNQDYAGGLRGIGWDLTGRACSSDYVFETYHVNTQGMVPAVSRAKFVVHSSSPSLQKTESFTLDVGKTKVLQDGTKIILKDSLNQAYAGGTLGAVFELICS